MYFHKDVRRFGPAILVATEGFEGWNGVFRLCSIWSNHQALSRDIGVTLTDMERFKHQASGGWWKPHGSQDYIQAGHEIISFLHNNKELQCQLGWMDKYKFKPGQSLPDHISCSSFHRLGAIKLDSQHTAVSGPWSEVLGTLRSPGLGDHSTGKNWMSCKYVISQAGDICKKQSWIFFKCKVRSAIFVQCTH
jgi:hypothetical protein